MAAAKKISPLDEVIALQQLFAEGLQRATTLRMSIEGEGLKKPSSKTIVKQMSRAVTKRNRRILTA